jgi:hypothetical protein
MITPTSSCQTHMRHRAQHCRGLTMGPSQRSTYQFQNGTLRRQQPIWNSGSIDGIADSPSLSPAVSSMAEGDDFHRFLELVNQAANIFETSQKLVESSGAHASSSPAPLSWPNYVPILPKLDVPAPASNLASPTVNLAPPMEPPSVLSTASRMEMGEYASHRMTPARACVVSFLERSCTSNF